MSAGTIRLVLEGKDEVITVDDFVRIVRHTIAILGSFDKESRWAIESASKSSPLNLDLHSDSEGAQFAIGFFLEGLSVLENEARRPPGFDDVNLTRVKRLTKPLGEGIKRLSYWTDGRAPLHVSQHAAASAEAIIHAPSYEVETELEGRLGQITVYGGTSEFCIYDPLTNRPTTCKFDPSDAEKVGALITHRLRVFGKARYSRAHTPEAITVEKWEPIGEPETPIAKLHSARFRLESNRRSEEIIRELRDLDD